MGEGSPIRLPDLIKAKRDGKTFEEEEISFFINGVVRETVDTAQIGAMLMAIYYRSVGRSVGLSVDTAQIGAMLMAIYYRSVGRSVCRSVRQ